jgi:hypothetical protein
LNPEYLAPRSESFGKPQLRDRERLSGQGMNRFCSRNRKRKGPIGKRLPAGDEKAMEINRADVAELVDARDLKSLDGNIVWVRVPPPAPGLD